MAQALIVRDRSIVVTESEKAAATKVLEQSIRGVDEKNHKRWRQFLRHVFSLEDGECAEIGTRIPRSGPFHRLHMAMEQAVFNAQERFAHFEQFRNWTKVACGFVTWVPGPKGGIVPLPKSISYSELDESGMRDLHREMLAFFYGPHAAKFLWPHLSPEKAAETMEVILAEFDR